MVRLLGLRMGLGGRGLDGVRVGDLWLCALASLRIRVCGRGCVSVVPGGSCCVLLGLGVRLALGQARVSSLWLCVLAGLRVWVRVSVVSKVVLLGLRSPVVLRVGVGAESVVLLLLLLLPLLEMVISLALLGGRRLVRIRDRRRGRRVRPVGSRL